MKYTYLCIILYVTGLTTAAAQNNTSPYSILGVGDIENSTFDRSTGMGNTGISLSSDRFIYQQNPASISRLADHFFNIELASRYKSVTYYGNPASSGTSSSADFQVKKLTLAIKVKPFWGVSAGILPFSTSNYSFFANKSIQGTVLLSNTYYKGSGGLNQYFLTNAFNINKHFSIGVQATYLAGSFIQDEALDSISLGTSLNTNRNIFLAKFIAKAGFQYQGQLSRKWKLGIGATASNKANLSGDYYLTVNSNGQNLVSNQSYKGAYFTIPLMYGGGISLTRNNALTLAADYQYQNWGSTNYSGIGYKFVNSNRISGGVQYAKTVGYGSNILERSNVQAGVFFGNSYLDINGYRVQDYGISLGAGFSSKTAPISCQFNLVVGRTGTTDNGLIRQDYIQFGVTVSYRDFWYTKLKKYF